ncbi:hypothetical protein EDC01DRAFT_635702 [Geopyxis carbonaria]|nr:hypothetical protein EDC01DRAFT_635702 [Geopyxis carbonaria]
MQISTFFLTLMAGACLVDALPTQYDLDSRNTATQYSDLDIRNASASAPGFVLSSNRDREFDVWCSTSSASPSIPLIAKNVATLRAQPADKQCCMTNPVQWCATIVRGAEGVSSDICGNRGMCTKCRTAGEYVNWVKEDCAKDGRAGGFVRTLNFEVNVYQN